MRERSDQPRAVCELHCSFGEQSGQSRHNHEEAGGSNEELRGQIEHRQATHTYPNPNANSHADSYSYGYSDTYAYGHTNTNGDADTIIRSRFSKRVPPKSRIEQVLALILRRD